MEKSGAEVGNSCKKLGGKRLTHYMRGGREKKKRWWGEKKEGNRE